MADAKLPYHAESRALVSGSPERVFEYLDDPDHLTGHMNRRSAMMLGSRFRVEMDEQAGRAVGSVVRMAGRILGIWLSLEEGITERQPPRRKVWQTIGIPRLLVLSSYRMGFEISTAGTGTSVRVFIDYGRPERGLPRLLGWLLGALYARWCTRRMVADTVRWFRRTTGGQ